MTGRAIGMLSLRLDAAYCLILGAGVAFTAPFLATVVSLPVAAVAVAGGAVILWAGVVLWMSIRLPLRLALRAVMIANIVATCAIAGLSAAAAGVFAILAILAIAADVALFAGSQAIALRRLQMAPAP